MSGAAAVVSHARRLEGTPFASEIRDRVATEVAEYRDQHGYPPGLAVVVCGRSAPSMVYLERILKACAQVGIDGSVCIAETSRSSQTSSFPVPACNGTVG